jgi:hypothetical protein
VRAADPNVSEEAKEHSRQVIDEIEASGEADDVRERYDAEGGKDQTRVLAGHKATLKSDCAARLLHRPCIWLMCACRRPERQRGGQGALAPGPRRRGRDLNFPSVGALSLSLWAAAPGPRATSNACMHVPLRPTLIEALIDHRASASFRSSRTSRVSGTRTQIRTRARRLRPMRAT